MTYLTNDPSDFVAEMLDGFVAVHGDTVSRVPGGVVRAHETPTGQVAVVIGGGSGHYPAFCGLVGPGLAHGAAMGEVFASPSAARVESVARAAHGDAGVLLSYGNYAGDVLNFDEAQERLRADGIDCRTVIVTDDVSSAPVEQWRTRRGVAGDLTVFKVAAAAAEKGLDLDAVVAIAERANERTRTMGVAFTGCTLPGATEPLFTVPRGRMGVGMGIHGEPGVSETDVPIADELAEMLVSTLLDEVPDGVERDGARVAPLVNGLGSIKNEELFLLYGAVARRLEAAGLTLVQPEVGELVTSFEMAGVSLTLFWLDDELERLWAAPASAPAYRKGVASSAHGVQRAAAVDAESAVDGDAAPESIETARMLSAMLATTARTIDAVADELGRLDAVAGDGDHGIGMQNGARAANEAAAKLSGTAGAESLLRAAGDAWADRAGGTSGALWGAMLREAGQVLGNDEAPDARRVSAAITAAVDAVEARGGAQLGDKTMVDALVPFAQTFEAEVSGGATVASAAHAASQAATHAAAATADLTPRRGRARTHTEKSIGTPDPGAHSFALIVTAIAAEFGDSTS
ncbi:MAG: dihydroxyacetone kinase family protein [Microcella sp.]|uniref:dihydroxyacetone kinase family protein n=1 Tax=Microcella sp. TaxID=1913979 RepID=UPI0024C9E976|nr:dihydroxyacetone kinase family protein [Microcella sp.]UYN83178.1 MAG: dihydroxyacetone kinase family protein [Microcella sp.]